MKRQFSFINSLNSFIRQFGSLETNHKANALIYPYNASCGYLGANAIL